MMIKSILSILALSTLAEAEDLLRHRKERYAIPELDPQTAEQNLEDERDRLRHEVCKCCVVRALLSFECNLTFVTGCSLLDANSSSIGSHSVVAGYIFDRCLVS